VDPTPLTDRVRVDGARVRFELADPGRRLSAARLVVEIDLRSSLEMRREGGRWTLEVQQPDEVDRFEYLFEIEDRRGRTTTVTDPTNPERAPGAFGEKSVLRLASYRAPAWLEEDPVPSSELPFDIVSPSFGDRLGGTLWLPDGLAPDEHGPLLVVHDGPEYAGYASLTRYLGVSVARGRLPPLRAALLAPGERDRWYSANPAYANALAAEVLPALEDIAPSTARIALGASLGALALLHAHHIKRGLFDAMLLQSGSYFTARTDAQERRLVGFGAVSAFVRELALAAPDEATAVPMVLTCGLGEENLANNRAMAGALDRLGYEVDLVETRDAHNFTAWRDAMHPHLGGIVASAVGKLAA
jgi:enterochelin esterase-like enzyme